MSQTEEQKQHMEVIQREMIGEDYGEAYNRLIEKCQCDNPTCAKCLLINCEVTGCTIHTAKSKQDFKAHYGNR